MKKFFSSIKTTRGFTLIELLIVVAIIGILSAVVLSSLGSARSKAKEAKAKSQMSSIRAQAELFYSSNGNSYLAASPLTGDVFSNSSSSNGAKELVTAVNSDLSPNTVTSKASANEWAAFVPLSNGKTFCVDSNGFSGETPTVLSSGVTKCQ